MSAVRTSPVPTIPLHYLMNRKAVEIHAYTELNLNSLNLFLKAIHFVRLIIKSVQAGSFTIFTICRTRAVM
jgi:hypothetical protein